MSLEEEHLQILPGDGGPPIKLDLLFCKVHTDVLSKKMRDRDFQNLQALNSYFNLPVQESTKESCQETLMGLESCFDLKDEETTDSDSSKTSTSERSQQEDHSIFSFITWYVDGLNLNNLQERSQEVCSYFTLYSPDVVFLQEAIPPNCSNLKKRTSSCEIITVKFKSQEIIPFPNSKMMRNLLCVYKMQEAPESATVIFTGDTNLRNHNATHSNLHIQSNLYRNIIDIFHRAGTNNPKICMEPEETLNSQEKNVGKEMQSHWHHNA
ncbi:unnamed protein product [Nyctereutes procyonoides]|uniref:(raccoon dog) hypothetical protein n=1 Tax=Nyctereutes procyonoides TaxID=34880 RepID=A0A811Y542_NYCPR|nr:unnamed protein product [Nyctereutes procyonoides]